MKKNVQLHVKDDLHQTMDAKDYQRTIDELREKIRKLKSIKKNQATSIESKTKHLLEKQNEIYDLKEKNEKLEEKVRANVKLLDEITELKKQNLELIKKTNEQSVTINTSHKDSSLWKQREELKEENVVLRLALCDIATNLGNGSSISPAASLPFIKELPHEVKLVCDGLRKELAREKKTCNSLREELKNPPPDVQEKALDMLGVNKQLIKWFDQYNELRREIEYYLKDFPWLCGSKAILKILKKHDEQTN